MRILFLGTSAGAPTRERNVACVAVVMDGITLLFDCGEGTQQQLLRSSIRLGAVDVLFLTHLHGDHLYGLPGLIATLGLYGRTTPLEVYGPKGVAAYFEAVRKTSYFNPAFDVILREVREGVVHRGDGYRIEALPLVHAVECLGYAVIEDDHRGLFDVDRARSRHHCPTRRRPPPHPHPHQRPLPGDRHPPRRSAKRVRGHGRGDGFPRRRGRANGGGLPMKLGKAPTTPSSTRIPWRDRR